MEDRFQVVNALALTHPAAYLAGCLKGDAWISKGHTNSIRGYIRLRVSDWDFANAFSDALEAGFGVISRPQQDERGYAHVRTYNGHGRFDELPVFEPKTTGETCAWLQGMFDSEGNATCIPMPKLGPGSWGRRIAFFSTTPKTLTLAQTYLLRVGIASYVAPWTSSKGHLGTRQVFGLVVNGGHENYSLFGVRVGSTIKRKMDAIRLIPTTYTRRTAS